MSEDSVRVVAHRFEQNGVTMYVAPLTADVINRLSVVDTYDPDLDDKDPEQGYQREVVALHAKKIAQYILDPEQGHLMPTAILLSSRATLPFEPLGIDANDVGWLTLNPPLYKVDGQHRTEAFGYARVVDEDVARFPLPTVILESRDKMEEIRLLFRMHGLATRETSLTKI